MLFSKLKIVLSSMLLMSNMVSAEAPETVRIQAHLKLEKSEAALNFTCSYSAKCEFTIGELEVRFSLGHRTTSVRLRNRHHDYIFFNNKSTTTIEFGRSLKILSVYDRASSTFVDNGQNIPVGSLEVSAIQN